MERMFWNFRLCLVLFFTNNFCYLNNNTHIFTILSYLHVFLQHLNNVIINSLPNGPLIFVHNIKI